MRFDEAAGLSRTMAFKSGVSTGGYMAETSTSTVVTAQIPTVPPAHHYGVLLPDGSVWYPGSNKRLPAPLALRVLVWALAFLVILAAAGDFIIRDHPAWVDPLRHMVPAAAGTLSLSTGSDAGRHHRSGAVGPTASASLSVTKLSPQPSGLPAYTTAYSVSGTSSYQIVVKVIQTTWVTAYHLSNGADTGTPIYASDVQPGRPATIQASGAIDLETAASGATVTVMSGHKQLGTLAAPPSDPWHFYLEPSSTK